MSLERNVHVVSDCDGARALSGVARQPWRPPASQFRIAIECSPPFDGASCGALQVSRQGVRYVATSEAIARRIVTRCRIQEGPFHDGTVVIIGQLGEDIAVNQPAFAVSGDGRTSWGRVVGVKVDDQNVQFVPGDSTAAQLGLELNFKVARKNRLFCCASTTMQCGRHQ